MLKTLVTAVALAAVATFAVADETKEGGGKDWKDHMGDLPFVVGYEKGMAEVDFTGRAPMFFFTTTW